MIWAAIFKAMMGLGLSLAIEKTASAGGAPPPPSSSATYYIYGF